MAYNSKTGMWEGYIYKIVNDINDIVYIGQTITTLRNRFYGHKSTAKNKPFSCIFASAIHKYGIEHFNIIEIDKIEHKDKKYVQDKLNQLEIQYIADFKANGIELYNMTIGGESQGNTWPEKPVIQYDLFCNEVNRFNSIVDAGNLTGTSHSDISSCCSKNGKIYKANNYIWRFNDEPLTKDEVQMYNKRYPGICQYDFDGNLINTFYTIRDAKKYLNTIGLKGLNISACCNGKCKSVEGFVWRYKQDSFDKYDLPKKHRMVEQRDKETGELIAKYNSCKEASDKTGFDSSCINQCCNGISYSSNGFIWCYEGDAFEINHKKYSNKSVSVDMYSIDKEFIKTFRTITEACNEANTCRETIVKVCKNQSYYAGGYIWRYHGDDINTYKDQIIQTTKKISRQQINSKIEPRIKPRIKPRIEHRNFKTGELINLYNSVYEASEATGLDIKIISKQCNLTYFDSYGLHGLWCIEGEYSDSLLFNFNVKEIDMYDNNGVLLRTFDCISDCLKFLNRYDQNIISAIKKSIEGKYIYALGYVWRKHGDPFDKYNQFNKINICDIYGNIVHSCRTVKDAAKYCGITYNKAWKSMQNKILVNGFVLFNKNEEINIKIGKFAPINMYDLQHNYIDTFNHKKDIYNILGIADGHAALNKAIENNIPYHDYYFELAIA